MMTLVQSVPECRASRSYQQIVSCSLTTAEFLLGEKVKNISPKVVALVCPSDFIHKDHPPTPVAAARTEAELFDVIGTKVLIVFPPPPPPPPELKWFETGL
jgi:hypothetical protein